MCGIFGVLNYKKGNPVDLDLLKQSTRLMTHRGPDDEGYYTDDKCGVGLGHRRLTIIDIETGKQPMSNVDQSHWIVFNGEIYNFQELKKYLASKGHKFLTKSDTEVLLAAYAEFGEEMTKKLNGIFAFAIWDKSKNKFFIARDHFGVKPLYYYFDSNVFVFSSEYKAIINYTKIERVINAEALFLCLNFRHTPAPLTLMQDIKKLYPGHSMSLMNGKLSISKYLDFNHILNSKKGGNYKEELKYNFELAVKRQMISDVPIGISLSGGIDSGAILATMTKIGGKVHAFTVGFEGNDSNKNEIKQAKVNAQFYGAEFNYELISENDYLDNMNKYIWHIEEPVGNESALAYYFVSRLANSKVKVLLNGQGADELFGGYQRYSGVYYSDRIRIPNSFLRATQNLVGSLRLKSQLDKIIELNEQSTLLSKISAICSILSPELRINLLNERMQSLNNSSIIQGEAKHVLEGIHGGQLVEKLLYFDMFTLLSENLLLSEDKMSMAASIEARVPFLDIELVNYVLGIPINQKIKYFNRKHILKKMCSDYFPKEMVYQKKRGFNNPMAIWINGILGKEINDLTHSRDSISQNYLNIKSVDKLVLQHKNGVSNNLRILFLIYSLEKWNNIFIKQ